VYTHPYGAERFFGTLRTWLDNANAIEKEGRFHWYTMTELAGFLNRRALVRWTLMHKSDGKVTLLASHPKTLAHQTWTFPQEYYGAARVVEGNATVRVEDGMVIVAAGDGRQLTAELTLRRDPWRSRAEGLEAKR
jgi:hypothetical protein